MKRFSLLPIVAVVFAAACQDVPTAVSPPAPALSRATVDRGFSGMPSGGAGYDGSNPFHCTMMPGEGMAVTRVFADAHGTFTHLGRTWLVARHCLAVDGDHFDMTDGFLVLIVANGDKLYGNYVGTSPWLLPPAGTIVEQEVTFTIYGGEGRFSNATGSGKIRGRFAYQGGSIWDLWPGTWTLEGQIRY